MFKIFIQFIFLSQNICWIHICFLIPKMPIDFIRSKTPNCTMSYNVEKTVREDFMEFITLGPLQTPSTQNYFFFKKTTTLRQTTLCRTKIEFFLSISSLWRPTPIHLDIQQEFFITGVIRDFPKCWAVWPNSSAKTSIGQQICFF